MGNACCNKSDDISTEVKSIVRAPEDGETTEEEWNVNEGVGDEGFS